MLEESLLPALRKYYKGNKLFRVFIDNISPESLREIFSEIANGMKKHTGEDFLYEDFSGLLDIDFCTTVQNLIQAPKRLTLEMGESWVVKQFIHYGFDSPRRCRRFVDRKNIRKYLAPLHYNLDSSISKILYGSGNMEWIAQKKS